MLIIFFYQDEWRAFWKYTFPCGVLEYFLVLQQKKCSVNLFTCKSMRVVTHIRCKLDLVWNRLTDWDKDCSPRQTKGQKELKKITLVLGGRVAVNLEPHAQNFILPHLCCIFRPAFGCCALQTLSKYSFSAFLKRKKPIFLGIKQSTSILVQP